MLASRLVQLPNQRPHVALVQPGGRGLRQRLTGTEVMAGESADHLIQSGIPSALIQAKERRQAWRLTDHGRVSRWLSDKLLHGGVPVVSGQKGRLVCQLTNQRPERILLQTLSLGCVHA